MSTLILNVPGLHHIPGLFQYFATLLGIFIPNIHPKPPLVELEGVPSCPITFYVGEEIERPPDSSLLSGSCGEEKGLDLLPEKGRCL